MRRAKKHIKDEGVLIALYKIRRVRSKIYFRHAEDASKLAGDASSSQPRWAASSLTCPSSTRYALPPFTGMVTKTYRVDQVAQASHDSNGRVLTICKEADVMCVTCVRDGREGISWSGIGAVDRRGCKLQHCRNTRKRHSRSARAFTTQNNDAWQRISTLLTHRPVQCARTGHDPRVC